MSARCERCEALASGVNAELDVPLCDSCEREYRLLIEARSDLVDRMEIGLRAWKRRWTARSVDTAELAGCVEAAVSIVMARLF